MKNEGKLTKKEVYAANTQFVQGCYDQGSKIEDKELDPYVVSYITEQINTGAV